MYCLIASKVQFGSHEDDLRFWAILTNLFDPFVLDVAEGRRVDEGKAKEKNVGFVVRDLA